MKKSLNAWSIPAKYSFEEAFKFVSEAGFDGIELNLDREDSSSHSLTMQSSNSILREIRELSGKYGLAVSSISSSLYGSSLGDPDKSARERGKDILKKQLLYASELNSDGILVVPGADFEQVSLPQAYENASDAIGGLKKDIEASKVKVGLENVWNAFFTSPFDMCNFIDNLDSEYIGAYFDVGNVTAFSHPHHWIEVLGRRIVKVHIKDFKRTSGINSGGAFVNLLEGSIDWKKVIKALKKAGYDGFVTAELPAMEDCTEYLCHITSRAFNIIFEGDGV